MGIPRKGTRLIAVDGHRYRWAVAPNDEPGFGVVVELADPPGQRLLTWLDHGNIVTPRVVRRIILHGLQHGWDPHRRGPQTTLRLQGFISDIVHLHSVRPQLITTDQERP
jgi:hypothetical protein